MINSVNILSVLPSPFGRWILAGQSRAMSEPRLNLVSTKCDYLLTSDNNRSKGAALKLIEILLSHRLLFAVPLVLGAAGGAVLMMATAPAAHYLSSASVWIDRPDVISGLAATDFNPYVSPAQNQASVMHELLASRSFATAIAKDLAETDVVTEGQIANVRTNTYIWPAGD